MSLITCIIVIRKRVLGEKRNNIYIYIAHTYLINMTYLIITNKYIHAYNQR